MDITELHALLLLARGIHGDSWGEFYDAFYDALAYIIWQHFFFFFGIFRFGRSNSVVLCCARYNILRNVQNSKWIVYIWHALKKAIIIAYILSPIPICYHQVYSHIFFPYMIVKDGKSPLVKDIKLRNEKVKGQVTIGAMPYCVLPL